MKTLNNYTSLVIGSQEECLSSEHAYLLTFNFDPNSTTLEELKEKLKEVIEDESKKKEVLILDHSSQVSEVDDNTALFERLELDRKYKFNSIIFGNYETNSIFLAVKFSNEQTTTTLSGDIIRNVKLELSVDAETSEESESSLVNLIISLSDVTERISDRVGIEPYKFKSSNFTREIESYNKYTSRVNQVLEDPDMAIISGECGVHSSSGSWGFWIRDYEDISDYSDITVFFWNSDICVLKFNQDSLNYSINSLVKDNSFGKSLTYKTGKLPNDFLNLVNAGYNSKFYKTIGTNIIYLDDYYYFVFSASDDYYYKTLRVENSDNKIITSSDWDFSDSLEITPTLRLFKELDTVISPKVELNKNLDIFVEKIGNRFKIKHDSETYFINDGGIFIDSIREDSNKDIIFKNHKLIPINNNLFLLYYRIHSQYYISIIPISQDYQKLIYEDKEFKLEFINKEKETLENSTVIDGLNINYDNVGSYYRIIFDGLRRKPFRIMFPNPKDIITLCGLIFYTENNKLYLY